ncbi:hypothetical protein SteCoe_37489 [Stentor coeruleus]|uniref:Uncharacterized protein n=1 Tax=Stentor coeruleus TaxID=5963 RepID=A0A1R2AMW4_9CILI|nr:hypothetical protein SteCoe_37489 [Stentor coeruleus]
MLITAVGIISLYIIYKAYQFFKPVTFHNKTVWITGASSGIGEYLAYEFVSKGAFVILSGRNMQELQRVHEKIPKQSKIIIFDLSDANKTLENANEVCMNNTIDILINNAGISQRGLFEEMLDRIDIERKLMEINYFSVIAMSKAYVKNLNGRKGCIVVVSSLSGLIPAPLRTGYSAAKAGIIGYFESMRSELKDLGVDVVNVSPGFVNTNVSINSIDSKGNKANIEDSYNKNGFSPACFAKDVVNSIYRGETNVIKAQYSSKLVYLLRSVSPLLALTMVKKFYTKNAKKIVKN